jgi:hypothetical protein
MQVTMELILYRLDLLLLAVQEITHLVETTYFTQLHNLT